MNKFNLPVLWVWVLIALSATLITNFTENKNTVFETQSVRTTRSLWLSATDKPAQQNNAWLVPDQDTFEVYWMIDKAWSRWTIWINDIPCADVNGDGMGDIVSTSWGLISKRKQFKEVQWKANCECIHNPVDLATNWQLKPYILVNNEWKILDSNNRATYCPNWFFLSNWKQLELLWSCNPEVIAFGYWKTEKDITAKVALAEFKNVCNNWVDTNKDYCKVTFNPQSPTLNQPYTITVNWKVTNGMTIQTFIQWPNSAWWWTNNFSSWFPLVLTETKDVPWTYVYKFIIKGDSVITCEWTITIWKRIGVDQPVWPGPVVTPDPIEKPRANNNVWTINLNANGVQPRSLRQ